MGKYRPVSPMSYVCTSLVRDPLHKHGITASLHLITSRALQEVARVMRLPTLSFHSSKRHSSNNNNNRIQRRYSRFFTISSQRRELSPTRTLKWPGRSRVQITCDTSSAYQVQVSCYVPLGTKGQLSYWVWQRWNRIYLSFILLAEPLNRWRRGENRSSRRKPLTTSFRKCHILKPEDSSPKRDSNPRSSIGGRLGKQTC